MLITYNFTTVTIYIPVHSSHKIPWIISPANYVLYCISICSFVRCLVFIPGCRPNLALRCFFLSGCSKLSNRECYLLILGHLQSGCCFWGNGPCEASPATFILRASCVSIRILVIRFYGSASRIFKKGMCGINTRGSRSGRGCWGDEKGYYFYRDACRKLFSFNICLRSSGFCALHLLTSYHFIPWMAEMVLIAGSQTPWPSGNT